MSWGKGHLIASFEVGHLNTIFSQIKCLMLWMPWWGVEGKLK